MIFAKRVAVLFFTAVILIVLLRTGVRNYHYTLQGLSQNAGSGELIEVENEGEANQQQEQDLKQAQRPAADPLASNSPVLYHDDSSSSSRFPPGTPKPAGESYTRAFIAGRLTTENTTWLETYLPTDPTLTPFIYVVNDQTAPLHTPINKGHEAMVYLTYILDQYDSPTLPDINIFMHPHRIAWHNPELLNHDAIEALKRLSSERVMRQGYMNLRCHWDPGCPERIHPTSYHDNLKREEIALAAAWAEMFPSDPIPSVVAAPCCAQFAVSRDRIRSIPKAHYARYRDWLLRTKETDWISGRVFEYLWHKIFTGQDKLCPDTRSCYCDGYGICFSTPEIFETWFDNHHWWRKAIKELEQWEERARTVDEVRRDWKKIEGMRLDVPLPGRNWELRKEIEERFQLLARVRVEALKNGTDPDIRARVAGRLWEAGEGY